MEEEKSKPYSKVIVMLIIILNIWFTVQVIHLFSETGSEPVALIGAFFAFTTGELWLMASIKKTKVATQRRDDEYADMGKKTNQS